VAHGLAEHMRGQRYTSVFYHDIPEQNTVAAGEAEVCRPTWTKESDEDTMTTCTAETCTICPRASPRTAIDEVPRRWIDRVNKEENNSTWPGRGNGDKVKNSWPGQNLDGATYAT
jgi:hypothetical protein